MRTKQPYRISDYRVDKEKLEAVLGPLESKVMGIVWSAPQGNMTVREVYGKLNAREQLAYTTIMSTMNTLHDKGLLDRKLAKGRGGLFYVYRPKYAQGDFERSAVRQIIESLTRNFGDPVASYLIEKATSSQGTTNLLKKALDERLSRTSKRRR